MTDTKLIYMDGEDKNNWFFDKYYASGSNSRFWTFSMAMNLLNQGRNPQPVIVETGCQRQKDDLGAGMSTSIFAEYITRYGGELHVVDNDIRHLNIAEKCVEEWLPEIRERVTFNHDDSVVWLSKYKYDIDLLYLDSWDYPYGELLDAFGGKEDITLAEEKLNKLSHAEVRERFGELIYPSQQHCVREFQAIEENLSDTSIVLIDDNRLPGGGKPGLLKPYLLDMGWKCLFDFQQTLWIKELP